MVRVVPSARAPLTAVLTLLILSCLLPSASAQDAGAIYAFGGIAFTHQGGPSGLAPQTYVVAPGGTTTGWLFGGGVFLARIVAVDAEVSSTGWMRATEPSRYGYTYHEERRDRFVAIAARLALALNGTVTLEPIGGVVFTYPQAYTQADRDLSQISPRPGLEVGPRIGHDLDTGIGIVAGAELRIGRRRFAVLPSFRLMQSGVEGGRYDADTPHREITAIYPSGYPDWTWRGGVALRVDF